MVAITALKPDDVVYDVVSQKMGNTTMRRQAVFKVRIVSVAEDGRSVMACWNGNTARKHFESQVRKWRRTPPAEK
ncbi:hypothetical protein H8F21_14045 [Pseudomonas sp. P66]|uniref:Uncharacterized protein n=1 Tax=Pseudomonas arcuscaelestis TaxID=2710591 RepID=A0ABS2BYI1_9PSED|nr:hypothetical protein [Pseudomonas arcuscaelestis]MBM5458686.1 hypothetical protein [Pseudomonas arcuscaelestis]